MTINCPNQAYLAKWEVAAQIKEIPPAFYEGLQTRLVGKDNAYPMAVIYNPGRIQRPGVGQAVCNLCRIAEETTQNSALNLIETSGLDNYTVCINEFPPTKGAAMVLTKKDPLTQKDIPMYNTNTLSQLGSRGEEIAKLLAFANRQGLRLFHQTYGAGATIPDHEHWHLTTLYTLQDSIGSKFGFDAAELKPVSGASHAYTMPQFPFAHMVFDPSDPEKIVHFLSRLSQKLPSPLPDGSIPHTFSQGEQGILITPTKINVDKSMGSERAPGFFFVRSREEYTSATYESAMAFMAERFFDKSVGLETLL